MAGRIEVTTALNPRVIASEEVSYGVCFSFNLIALHPS